MGKILRTTWIFVNSITVVSSAFLFDLLIYCVWFIRPSEKSLNIRSNWDQMSSFTSKQVVASYNECDVIDKLKYC